MSQSKSNQEIIREFKKAAAVLQIQDASIFRIRAYQNAIQSIENLDEELSSVVAKHALDQVPGIGKELSNKITDLVNLGESEELTKLFSTVPKGVFSLMEVPGVGPKRAYQIALEFGLDDEESALEKLKELCEQQKLRDLPRFGAKLEAQILENLGRERPKSDRLRLNEGDELAARVVALLNSLASCERVSVLGSLRRREETVGDVDIAVATKNPEALLKELRQSDKVVSIQASGGNIIRLLLPNNKQVDIKFQAPEKWGATLQHFTGSKLHNIALRELALKQGKSLSEHGIKEDGKLKTFSEEADFYQYLGLPWIPPELRTDTGEIDAAKQNQLPELITEAEIKADFHTHTDFPMRSSHDSGEDVLTLLSQAAKRGYTTLGLGDHNPSPSFYKEKELVAVLKARQSYLKEKFAMWQEANPDNILNMLITMEIDILPDGSLPLPEAAFEYLDFAIISIHSRFEMSLPEQTERILKAMEYPKVKIIGHPTGRLINKRNPIQVDWSQIYAGCVDKNIALEINASPHRLDFPDSLVRDAARLGVQFAISTDAHRVAELNLMSYRVSVARRGWLSQSAIINSKKTSELESWLKQ